MKNTKAILFLTLLFSISSSNLYAQSKKGKTVPASKKSDAQMSTDQDTQDKLNQLQQQIDDMKKSQPQMAPIIKNEEAEAYSEPTETKVPELEKASIEPTPKVKKI